MCEYSQLKFFNNIHIVKEMDFKFVFKNDSMKYGNLEYKYDIELFYQNNVNIFKKMLQMYF